MKLLLDEWNLRWNPFRGVSAEEWKFLAVTDVEPFLEFLTKPGRALQFMGDAGRGKSTHLHAIHRYFPNTPFVYLHDREKDPSPWPKIPNDQMCFIDESQRLGWFARHKQFKRWRTLILGTHEDHSKMLYSRGFKVLTIDVSQKDSDTIHKIFQTRIHFARRREKPVPVLASDYIASLVLRYGDNLRGMEQELYLKFMDIKKAVSDNIVVYQRESNGQM